MTAKEKAEDLFGKYFNEVKMPSDCEGCMQCVDRCGSMVAIAKKYALIAVDEMHDIAHRLDDMDTVGYLLNVIQELEKL